MIRVSLAELEPVLDARRVGDDVICEGLSTDSRRLAGGELFVAIKGPNFDGNAFLRAAREAGAGAVVAERAPDPGVPALVVRDSRQALGLIGRHWRRQMPARLAAITGSNGKTTVKEMLASILALAGETLATRGNLNNDIGVPLTLARLHAGHRYAVIEMGANHAGEIAWLGQIAEPEVGIVTNAGPAHLEGFGSLDGVARAKGELFQLLGPDGVAVINADDRYAPLWRQLAEQRTVLDFGTRPEARVRADEPDAGGRVRITLPAGTIELQLPVPGRHNLLNALAAAAAASALEIPADLIRQGLEAFRPVAGRLQRGRSAEGALVIDDSYNANPASLAAGLAVLVAESAEPWLVLGDMAELGPESPVLHAAAGRTARESGVRRLYATGPMSVAAVDAFGAGGRHFDTRDALLAALREDLRPDVAVLVKGSRSMGMEQVVMALLGRDDTAGGH